MKAPINNSRCAKLHGRRTAGSWGRPGKRRHAIANRATRHAAKKELNNVS